MQYTKEQLEARKKITDLVDKAERLIEVEATDLADDAGISFDAGEYGSGRTYYPKGMHEDEVGYSSWNEPEFDEERRLVQGIWVSSSDNC